MADLTYVATLDDSQVLKALQNIDRNIDKMSGQADKNFQSIGKSASSSGLQIGAMAGVVSSLVTEFINLGKQAVDVLISIGQQSVQTALEIDTLKARLGGIFDGNKEAADQAFNFIQSRSVALGIDLKEIAGAFLPKVESLAQFEQVAKIATALARSDPEQGAIGARIALIEALSGTFTSLQRRFEIPKQDIDALKEAFDTGGMEAFLTKFEEVLAASGKGFDDLADTAQSSFDRVAEAGLQLGGIAAAPIVESLEAAATKILAFLGTMKDGVFTFNDDIVVFADTIGRSIAEAIDLLASIDLGQIDTDKLIEVADYIFRIVKAVEVAVSQFTGFVGAIYQVTDAVTPLGEILDYLIYIFANIDDALITGAQILAIAKAGYVGLYEGIQPVVEILDKLYDAASQAASGDFAGASQALSEAVNMSTQDLFDNAAALAARDASMAESIGQIQEYQKGIDRNTEAQRKLRDELEKTKTAGTGAADGVLEAGAAERQAAEDAEKLTEAQAKVNEELAKAEKDFARKLEDIDIATERKRLDIAIEFAQKREDAAKNNLQKLADLRKKNSQDVDDAAKDLNRKEEDIARKFSQERIDLEQDNRQKRVDIEKSYRETLQGIQSQFLADAEESERKRDAVGFLRAVRERDKKVKEAQDNRTKEITETQVTGELKRQELALQQQRELEEAAIANERKLEDLKTNLNRQIEEQNTAYARQLDDLMTAEARKNEELNRSREQDIEDAKLAYERKLEDLKVSLAAELEIIAAGNAAIEAEAERHAARMEELAARQKELKGRGIGSARNTPTRPAAGSGQAQGRHPGDIPGFASGGTVPGPRGAPMLAMVHGGERIIPNSPVMMPAMSPGGASYNVTNNNQRSASLGGLLDASNLDAMLQTRVQNILLNLLGNL